MKPHNQEQSASEQLIRMSERMYTCEKRGTLGGVRFSRVQVTTFSALVGSEEELKVLAVLFHRILNFDETFTSSSMSILRTLRSCFGLTSILEHVDVIRTMVSNGVVSLSDSNMEEFAARQFSVHTEMLRMGIQLSDRALSVIYEIDMHVKNLAEEAEGQDMTRQAVTNDRFQQEHDEEDEVRNVINHVKAKHDPRRSSHDVPDEIEGATSLFREETVDPNFVYVPDAAMADTFSQIVSVAANNITSVLRQYGISGVASHYTPVRHDRLAILLSGAPGTGKTAAAYALAAKLQRRLFVTSVDALKSPWAGVFERNTRRLFEEFRELSINQTHAPILLIDECEALFASRSQDTLNSAVRRSDNASVDILLQELEKFEGILILTTNTPDVFDEAFSRRIDYKVHITKTAPETQRAVWKLKLPASFPGVETIDVDQLVSRFDMTPATITLVVRNTLVGLIAANPTSHRLTQDALEHACAMHLPGAQRTSVYGFV
jgi:hypothetical protein